VKGHGDSVFRGLLSSVISGLIASTLTQGSYWEFFDLSNGGCYLAPSQDFYHLVHPGGDYDATVSGDAAGIVATLYTFSHLSFHFEQDPFGTRVSDLFHLLRDYAAHHPEAELIFRLID
jgi:hypothetical protein